MQWQEMDFPILVDSLNRIGVSAVPLLWALDEHGVIRKVNPKLDWVRDTFLLEDYEAMESDDNLALLESEEGTVVAQYLDQEWTDAIEGWHKAEKAAPKTDSSRSSIWFRLGCAYRARFDSEMRKEDDFQQAVVHWTKALKGAPRNYIYRRRVEQYGPRMNKPYPFYDWIDRARTEIAARGEEPHPLSAEPRGAELAQRARGFGDTLETARDLESDNKLDRDLEYVQSQIVVAPYPIEPGRSARVSVLLSPSSAHKVHWTNDAGPASLVVLPPDSIKVDQVSIDSEVPTDSDVSDETRQLDFEVLVPKGWKKDSVVIPAYVLYYVCLGDEGECLYRRQDLKIEVPLAR